MQEARLVAESGADGDTFAALGAAAAEDGGAALGLHAGPEAVGGDALAAIWLKCALGHGNALLLNSRGLLGRMNAFAASLKCIAEMDWNPAHSRLFLGRGGV